MKVVVVGGDGRAHVLADVLARTCDAVVVSGGNAGMAALGVDVTAAPPDELDADLFVISPEAPLVQGLADRLRAQGKRVFGPGADGARLEGSKAWMKEVVAAAGVPTAAHASFHDPDPAIAFLRSLPPPYVVKTDGLAAGKGVLVTDQLADAEHDVRAKLAGASFGDAGRTVVIEEGMVGAELSVLAVCDGRDAVALVPARDYKRALDGDAGPNTGGMGSFAPAAGDAVVDDVLERFVRPTLHALRERGIDYRGTLYAGLMLTADGLKLVEYNVRFGDPEAQVVLPLVTSDLGDLLAAAADGDLGGRAPSFSSDARVCVIAASPGYPDAPVTGSAISGLDEAGASDDTAVYCAGVRRHDDGQLVTDGGRVLGVVGGGPTVATARARAYERMRTISFAGMQYRTDIAADAAEEEGPVS